MVSKPSIGFKVQSSLCELRPTGKAAANIKPEAPAKPVPYVVNTDVFRGFDPLKDQAEFLTEEIARRF